MTQRQGCHNRAADVMQTGMVKLLQAQSDYVLEA